MPSVHKVEFGGDLIANGLCSSVIEGTLASVRAWIKCPQTLGSVEIEYSSHVVLNGSTKIGGHNSDFLTFRMILT